ncbi:hypothetical protein AM2_038 [Lactococcus phage AM2]|uniref:Uncharacterized protein n=7 Tax=Audreyjarvisvirus AM1 TaxID=2845188 RepID=A0A1W6JLH0_9CAUD|nr:hypothetical protein H1Z30_gp038 [Lactococcus phage AM1]ARM66343.1 hypothetical protein AM2_038 [Lactococcus phage AM2]ARM66520.1 hypothetical protein AM3_038 [Lactococcus phage AM3]ARM67073.1 hypothetical protein AM8_038 [Lactococcus phage AM8]ARM67251.1 hypothetical protein AM9_038 [Lactococcus phage AM9]ARM67430.1 hypothetical protein AM11_038 [Lactococcus phage AM11]ARQ95618.1 hypothetical protein AM12_039 [Lactococcus phage AM12]
MKFTTKEKAKIYFYDGFEQPLLLAENLKEFKNITISDNYFGDVTKDVLEIVRDCKNIDELKKELASYQIFVNPNYLDFYDFNLSVCLDFQHIENFYNFDEMIKIYINDLESENSYKIHKILNKYDFRKFNDYMENFDDLDF